MSGGLEKDIKDSLNTSSDFDLSTMLDTNPLFGGGGGCPGDVSVGQWQISFSTMCPQLNTIGQALVGFSYLVAAFIVFRGAKG